jgi:hypothetical protein
MLKGVLHKEGGDIVAPFLPYKLTITVTLQPVR